MNASPIDRERLLATFVELIGIDSPSRHEGAMARHMAKLLGELGAEVEFDDAAEEVGSEVGNLTARFPGAVPHDALLFCAHLDTIESTANLHMRVEDGMFKTGGSTILGADDKAGVSAIIELLRVLLETNVPRPDIEILFTVAEEVGLMGSKVVDYSRFSATCGFVPDSSREVGLIITRAPAQKHLKVTVVGKAAHAGMAPEDGINAITVAARAIAGMRQGRIDDETTANIGIITGGKATNIVPDTVHIEGEVRSRDPRKLDEQAEHMRARFIEEAEQAGAAVEIEISDVYPSFNLAGDARPVRLARKAAEAIGVPPMVSATGGGSDANFINNSGIPTVILSAGYSCPHSTDESLPADQLVKLAEWMFTIVKLAGEGE